MFLFGSRCLPENTRCLPGFGVHTFKLVGQDGRHRYCKFHFKPETPYTAISSAEEAAKRGAENPDYHHQDMWEAIERGGLPVWKVCVQVMEPERAQTYGRAVLDITKVWPHGEFPLIELGKMTLNKNVSNCVPRVKNLQLMIDYF